MSSFIEYFINPILEIPKVSNIICALFYRIYKRWSSLNIQILFLLYILKQNIQYAKIADPPCLFVGFYQGIAPNNARYIRTLTNVNIMQGGTTANLGTPAAPVNFMGGHQNYLQLDSAVTRERLIGALKHEFPFVAAVGGAAAIQSIQTIKTNPTNITIE